MSIYIVVYVYIFTNRFIDVRSWFDSISSVHPCTPKWDELTWILHELCSVTAVRIRTAWCVCAIHSELTEMIENSEVLPQAGFKRCGLVGHLQKLHHV